jgi:hypothetical protein
MGREVRRVPADWQHPKGRSGQFKPLHKGDYKTAAAEWHAEYLTFKPDEFSAYYWEYAGNPPGEEEYMFQEPPDPATLTHLVMYENTTEGTPISPAFATPEELARWLADTGASSFGHMKATYEEWLETCLRGWAPSMAITNGRPESGVAGLAGDTP